MKKFTVALVVLSFLLSGCSSQAKSEYDQVSLFIYQNCIDKATGSMKSFLSSEFYVDNAIEACQKYLPVKS